AVSRVEMPVVQVIIVVTMRDAQMAARLTVDMGMTGVGVMIVHYTPPFLLGDCRSRERRSQAVWRWARLTALLTLRRMARRQPPRAIKASISRRCGGYNSSLVPQPPAPPPTNQIITEMETWKKNCTNPR